MSDEFDLSFLDNWNGDEVGGGGGYTNNDLAGGSGYDEFGNPIEGDTGPISTGMNQDQGGFDLSKILNFATKYGGGLLGLLQNPDGRKGSNNAMNVLGSAIGAKGAGAVKGDFMKAWQNMLDADPFNRQTPFYQGLLRDVATGGIGNTAYGRSIADATARMDSAKGYNMSGNMLHDIAAGLNKGTVDYMGALTPLAMGRAPDTRGLAPIATGVAQSTAAQYNALGQGINAGSGALSDLSKNWGNFNF